MTDPNLAAVTDDELEAEYEAVSTGPTRDVIVHVQLIVRVVSYLTFQGE